MATDLPALHRSSTVRQKIAFEKAVEAAVDGQMSTLKTEIQAIVASAADIAELKTAFAQWAPYGA